MFIGFFLMHVFYPYKIYLGWRWTLLPPSTFNLFSVFLSLTPEKEIVQEQGTDRRLKEEKNQKGDGGGG